MRSQLLFTTTIQQNQSQQVQNIIYHFADGGIVKMLEVFMGNALAHKFSNKTSVFILDNTLSKYHPFATNCVTTNYTECEINHAVLSDKELIKLLSDYVNEAGYMIVTCNIQQATETKFHSTYTIKVGQSLDNLVNLDEYLESNGNHEALQMWKAFLNYTGLQIQ
jgi:hypothetical protein